MKKNKLFILIIVIFLCLVGCGTKENKELKSITVVAYIKSEATENDYINIENRIKNIKYVDVSSITFKSKDEVKQEMMDSNGTFNNIMSDWEDNPLLSMYIIKVIDHTKVEEVVKEIEDIDKIEVVKYDTLSLNN